MKNKRSLLLLLMVVCVAGCKHLPVGKTGDKTAGTPVVFRISFSEAVRSEPITGRLLLFLSETSENPRAHFDWFKIDPVFAMDVTNLPPGVAVEFTAERFKEADALAFPKPLGKLAPGSYWVQAVLDADNTTRDWNDGPGNLYGEAKKCVIGARQPGSFDLVLSKTVTKSPSMETNEWVELVEIKSTSLSSFHGRDVNLRAAVLLPYGYHESADRYPVVYLIPGFGGRHTAASAFLNFPDGEIWKRGEYPYRALQVWLDPEVPLGHSVFANSDNNGPVGDALVQELIPAIEQRYRVISEPWARVVGGHSSGGWASLWLQTAYPDFFGACWSTAPDPVDFRFFQTMNIYQDQNGHWGDAGEPRGLARDQHNIVQTFAMLNHWEYVTGPGGQLGSFNAVFSRRGSDGRPEQLMDKLSGAINPKVAEDWKRYDIRFQLEKNWTTLGPKLHGKIHIICGSWDNFYLDRGVRGLAEFLSKTDYGGYVRFVPGDHGSMWNEKRSEEIRTEIARHFEVSRPKRDGSQMDPQLNASFEQFDQTDSAGGRTHVKQGEYSAACDLIRAYLDYRHDLKAASGRYYLFTSDNFSE